MFDLPGYVMPSCALGIRDVEPSPADTYADETIFSATAVIASAMRAVRQLISVIAMAA